MVQVEALDEGFCGASKHVLLTDVGHRRGRISLKLQGAPPTCVGLVGQFQAVAPCFLSKQAPSEPEVGGLISSRCMYLHAHTAFDDPLCASTLNLRLPMACWFKNDHKGNLKPA